MLKFVLVSEYSPLRTWKLEYYTTSTINWSKGQEQVGHTFISNDTNIQGVVR